MKNPEQEHLAFLLAEAVDKLHESEDKIFQAASRAMPYTMLAVLEELRRIPDAVPLSMEFITHYHQPSLEGPVAHIDYKGDFTQFEFKAPTPEIVLKVRVYLNSRRKVRTVIVSTLGLHDLHKLAEHLSVDTFLETYIGPYKWEQNWVLKND